MNDHVCSVQGVPVETDKPIDPKDERNIRGSGSTVNCELSAYDPNEGMLLKINENVEKIVRRFSFTLSSIEDLRFT